jgi:hypothetical protein
VKLGVVLFTVRSVYISPAYICPERSVPNVELACWPRSDEFKIIYSKYFPYMDRT